MSAGSTDLIVRRPDDNTPLSILRRYDDWGLISLDLAGPPRRFWADGEAAPVPIVDMGIDVHRVDASLSPAQLLAEGPGAEPWAAMSRRSLARLRAYFLIGEDPQRRLDARQVNTLAHQVSLVRHILETPSLRRVLIADEVGLGKTIEAGLLIQELIAERPGLRVLYLAPARLVRNVRRELNRLDLGFRQWTATDRDAHLQDPLVVASIHKAVHGNNTQEVLKSGPWDLLIVDECHHLTDWEAGGGNPRENYKLVQQLLATLDPDVRVIFMSGTPHQGNETRFENLLRLLTKTGEAKAELAGRVIYRTKDDVTDWNGDPLFPARQVNAPLLFEASDAYRNWLRHIHGFFNPGELLDDADAGRRAAGWRCAQALQWAASSPQAGLGYLVRQAIRAGWKPGTRNLNAALAELRPYRFGSVDEGLEALFERICKEIGLASSDADSDASDDLEDEGTLPTADANGLAALLDEGMTVAREAGDSKWDLLRERVLDPAGDERIVLFAQPIETVTAVVRYLQRRYKVRPAVIIGGQTDQVRSAEIARFWAPDGPRFLVSSRAGGEGINLQVARRLVHIDVPWNPMELEQRVGRVHRFGSRETILVDTMVMKHSREMEAYAVADRKLRLIANTLVQPDRVDALFARVMCLIPPDDLQRILLRDAPGSAPVDEDSIASLVQAGFQKWRRFDETYSKEQKKIRALDPGLAAWDDVDEFLAEHADARRLEDFWVQRFTVTDGGVTTSQRDATVVAFADNTPFACGDYSGAPVYGPGNQIAQQLGLNVPQVTEALRKVAFPSGPTGAAHVRWPSELDLPEGLEFPFGVVVTLRQALRMERDTWREGSLTLHVHEVTSDRHSELQGAAREKLLRGLFRATVRVKPETAQTLVDAMRTAEDQIAATLRRPTQEQQDEKLRFAVMPLVAAVVGAPGKAEQDRL